MGLFKKLREWDASYGQEGQAGPRPAAEALAAEPEVPRGQAKRKSSPSS